jgi:ATP-binding cassette subfamily C (CFTR/MRP) protein 1
MCTVPCAPLDPQVLCRMATSGWLAWWCSEEGAISRDLGGFVGGYLLWVIATLLVSVGRDCTFAYAELHAASALHNAMLAAVMHAPMSFFDTTPLGRIVARFSKDQDTLDKKLPESFNSLVACLLDVTCTPAATACT